MKNEKKQIPLMHSRIHVCISYQKENHNMSCIITSCHPSYSKKSLKIISIKK